MKFAVFPLTGRQSLYAKEVFNILSLKGYERVLDMCYNAGVEDRVKGYDGYLICVIGDREIELNTVPIYDPASNTTLQVDIDEFAELLGRMDA